MIILENQIFSPLSFDLKKVFEDILEDFIGNTFTNVSNFFKKLYTQFNRIGQAFKAIP